MQIEKYFPYFHDGSITQVLAFEKNIVIAMESAEIPPSEVDIPQQLSNNSRFRGRLILSDVRQILDAGIPVEAIRCDYDNGEILDLEKIDNKIKIAVIWKNYTTEPRKKTECCSYEIEFGDIYWQNIPDYPDRFAPRIEPYAHLFSRGKILDIYSSHADIDILMESPVLEPNACVGFDLSPESTLKGKLAIQWVTSVTCDDKNLIDDHVSSEMPTILSVSIAHHECSLFLCNPVTGKVFDLTLKFGAIEWYSNRLTSRRNPDHV